MFRLGNAKLNGVPALLSWVVRQSGWCESGWWVNFAPHQTQCMSYPES